LAIAITRVYCNTLGSFGRSARIGDSEEGAGKTLPACARSQFPTISFRTSSSYFSSILVCGDENHGRAHPPTYRPGRTAAVHRAECFADQDPARRQAGSWTYGTRPTAVLTRSDSSALASPILHICSHLLGARDMYCGKSLRASCSPKQPTRSTENIELSTLSRKPTFPSRMLTASAAMTPSSARLSTLWSSWTAGSSQTLGSRM
jgi:hypothetical protein